MLTSDTLQYNMNCELIQLRNKKKFWSLFYTKLMLFRHILGMGTWLLEK